MKRLKKLILTSTDPLRGRRNQFICNSTPSTNPPPSWAQFCHQWAQTPVGRDVLLFSPPGRAGLLRRAGSAGQRWRRRLALEPGCPDSPLTETAETQRETKRKRLATAQLFFVLFLHARAEAMAQMNRSHTDFIAPFKLKHVP